MNKENPPSINQQLQLVEPQNQNKILLICDFTGNIVFWKGDPKVFDLPPSQYLRKNILSFDFTLFSRLKLTSNLTMGLLKQNQIKHFQLQILKKTSNAILLPPENKARLKHSKTLQSLITHIKLLKVAASMIQGQFLGVNKIGSRCQIQTFRKQKKIHKTHPQKIKNDKKEQKFLMFQVQLVSKIKDCLQSSFLKDLNTKEIRNKMKDIKFVKERNFKIVSYSEKHGHDNVKTGFDNSMKDRDLDHLFGSSRKRSAFKPHGDYLRKVSFQKSYEKFEEKKNVEKTEIRVIKERSEGIKREE